MRKLSKWISSFLVCGALLSGAAGATAQGYPERTIHIVVGAQPGGGTDAVARLIAQKLSEKWGQAVVVDNRPGAEGVVGALSVAHAVPDGYTFDLVNNNFTITPNFYSLKYDPIKSFTPVAIIGRIPDLLLVNPANLPVKSLQELIAYAKANSGKLNYGSNGKGSTSYLEMRLLAKDAGIEMTNVTYKGGAPALVALLGGETQLSFTAFTEGLPQVSAGKLRVLAVSTNSRIPSLPDVPTVSESLGGADFNFSVWLGVIAPAGTPADAIAKVHDAIAEIVASSDAQQKLLKLGVVTTSSTSAEFGKHIADELAKWKYLIATLNQ